MDPVKALKLEVTVHRGLDPGSWTRNQVQRANTSNLKWKWIHLMMERWSSRNIQYKNIKNNSSWFDSQCLLSHLQKVLWYLLLFFVNRIAIWLAMNATPSPQKKKNNKNKTTKKQNKQTHTMTVLVHLASLIFKIIFQPHRYFILVDNYIVHTYGVVGLVVEVHGVHIHTSGHHAGSTAG